MSLRTGKGVGGGGCAQVYALNTTDWKGSVIASLDCVAYNVVENGIVYPSFSLDGMVPYQVITIPSTLNPKP